jgi:hypothetical protein
MPVTAKRHPSRAVLEMVEDAEDYRAFEAAIIADYDTQTAVERELVLRLASLLWRLHRATSIETDLLRIPAEILHDRRDQRRLQDQAERPQSVRLRVLDAMVQPGLRDEPAKGWNDNERAFSKAEQKDSHAL